MKDERGLSAAWIPPDYSVRSSARARRVRLTMKFDSGLEVVIPRGFSRDRVPEVLESHQRWVERAATRREEWLLRLESDPPRLPDRIVLAALGEEWEVEYRLDGGPGAAGPEGGGAAARATKDGRVIVSGRSEDPSGCRDALGRWLDRRARRTLVPRLKVLSLQHGMAYERASVRQQRTRWGSCSRKKTISLNARLLFLPRDVVDYVLVHELCHTVEMNHSPRFWALVAKCDPDFKVHKKQLREARWALPTWLDGGLVDARE